MKCNRRTFILTAVLLTFILASCASTTLITSWKDEAYSGNVRKVLVIAVAVKKSARRVLEREYVTQLKGYGVEAVASHEILPDEKMIDKAAILSKIEGMDIDSVLISNLVSKEKLTTTFPGYSGYSGYSGRSGWYGSYSHSYERTYTDDIVNLETSLYDVKNEKLIWSAVSETTIMEGESSFEKIQPFVETILKNLSKDKLI